ncbi:argininosuccinate synthase [Candidatus Tremblaya phenacola PAVE]|nr:argininosuccinate synthase [Candidatus Tremblaya phenacola PAVE]
MPSITNSLPKGERVGMAFSGGLDTSTAMLWMRMNGAIPIAYLVDLGQDTPKRLGEAASKALEFGAERVNLLDCKGAIAELGLVVLQCRAFSVQTSNCFYYNTTPISRIVIGTAASLLMKEEGVKYWSDGSTHKGNDIERFFRYSTIVNPTIKFYKPWLDSRFVRELGGRKEMYEFLRSHNFKPETSEQETFSIDSNLLGSTFEAKMIERLDYSTKDVFSQRLTAKPQNGNLSSSEIVTVVFEKGRPISINGQQLRPVELFWCLNSVGKEYGLGVSDQIEDRIIGLKSRGIYEAPAMHILFTAFERLVTSICDWQTIRQHRALGLVLGKMLYDGDWFSPSAVLIRKALMSSVSNLISGEVTLELKMGGCCTILDTYSPKLSYDSTKLSMEKGASEFAVSDRLGQLNLVRPQMGGVRSKTKEYVRLGLLCFDGCGIPTSHS